MSLAWTPAKPTARTLMTVSKAASMIPTSDLADTIAKRRGPAQPGSIVREPLINLSVASPPRCDEKAASAALRGRADTLPAKPAVCGERALAPPPASGPTANVSAGRPWNNHCPAPRALHLRPSRRNAATDRLIRGSLTCPRAGMGMKSGRVNQLQAPSNTRRHSARTASACAETLSAATRA